MEGEAAVKYNKYLQGKFPTVNKQLEIKNKEILNSIDLYKNKKTSLDQLLASLASHIGKDNKKNKSKLYIV